MTNIYPKNFFNKGFIQHLTYSKIDRASKKPRLRLHNVCVQYIQAENFQSSHDTASLNLVFDTLTEHISSSKVPAVRPFLY